MPFSSTACSGVLTLYSPEPNAFDEQHGRLLQMILPHVAQAIDAARAHSAPATAASPRDLKLVASR